MKAELLDPQSLMTAAMFAKAAGVSTVTIWNRVSRGDLKPVMVGNRKYYTPQQLSEFKKNPRGRPRLNPKERLNDQIAVRVTAKERELLEKDAEKEGLSLSRYIRTLIFNGDV